VITHKITAVKNSENETIFVVVDSLGEPFDLDDKGATEVRVVVCDRLYSAEIKNVPFEANVITVTFGDLDLPPGRYLPKILYFAPDKLTGEIIAASCFETQIKLKMVC